MKILYQYVAPKVGAKIRLIEGTAFVPATPFQPATERRAFAVTLDIPGEYATFERYHDVEYAAGAFISTCEMFGDVMMRNQVVFVP
ncbi:hypothetical protein HAP48_0042855 [Bradyrhizobium septentrionale]|uniref:Uncharacterized protein n=1 Tax=Bradyrhizobium septentrionale TaxID=1404411 RepID=A0A973W2L9_9BRAD|nr:hypothetical protein [Bradyrhizobium septentrionale]UGY15198.1 hypothetical protein HAP48_0042855 [Bradyrhizobium septentrionale]